MATSSEDQQGLQINFVQSNSNTLMVPSASSNHISAPMIQINSEEASLDKLGGKESAPDSISTSSRSKNELVFLPRSVSEDLLKSELAVMSGGVDKKGHYVIAFPTKKHSLLSTQYAFADHLQNLINFYIDIVLQTMQSKKKFSFVLDQTNLNHTAISVIIRTLSNIQREKRCVDVLYVARPKEKKEFKTLQKMLGLGKSAAKSNNDMPKLNFAAVMLNEPREVQRFVDPANLPRQQGGYHPYQHEDFVKFFQRLEKLRRDCDRNVNDFNGVVKETMELQKLSRSSLTGLKRSSKVIEAHTQQIAEKLDLEQLSNECEAFLNDLTHPEREHVYAQIPRSILSPLSIREVEFRQQTVKKMLLELASVNKGTRKAPPTLNMSNGNTAANEKEDNKRCGIELLTWFKTIGPDTLKESMNKLSQSEDISIIIKTFHSSVVPFINEALEVAQEWIEFADWKNESESELRAEIYNELVPFEKEFHNVNTHYNGCEKFYEAVKELMKWYQFALDGFPSVLLDSEGRPDGKKLRVFCDIGQQQRNQLIDLRDQLDPLDEWVFDAVENNMFFITDTSLKNQSKILLQRCKLLEKLLDIYTLKPEAAKREISSRRVNLKDTKNLNSSLPPTLNRPPPPNSNGATSLDADNGAFYEALGEDGTTSLFGKYSDVGMRSPMTSSTLPAVPPRVPLSRNEFQQNDRKFLSTTTNVPDLNSPPSLPSNGHPPPLLPRSPKTQQPYKSTHPNNHGLKSLFSRNTKSKPSTLPSKGNNSNLNSIDATQGQSVDKRSPIHNGSLSQNGHHSPNSPRIVSESRSLEMNFLVPPEGQNYEGNVNKNYDQSPNQNDSAFNDLQLANLLSLKQEDIKPNCNLDYLENSLGERQKPDDTMSQEKLDRLLSKRDFYLMKDFETKTYFNIQQSSQANNDTLSTMLLKEDPIQKYKITDPKTVPKMVPKMVSVNPHKDLAKRNEESSKFFTPAMAEHDGEVLFIMTRQLIWEISHRVEEETNLRREKERNIRFQLLQEEIRQTRLKTQLQNAIMIFEASQRSKRK